MYLGIFTRTPWKIEIEERAITGHMVSSTLFTKRHKLKFRLLSAKVTAGSSFSAVTDKNVLAHSTCLEIVPNNLIDPWLLLAILNSTLFWRYVQMTAPTMGHGRHALRINQVKLFPLPQRTSWLNNDSQHAAKIAKIIMNSPNTKEKEQYQRDMNAIINQLYELS